MPGVSTALKTLAGERRESDPRKIHIMKKSAFVLALVLGLSTWGAAAQEMGNPPDQGGGPPPRNGGPRHDPIFIALDVNTNGIIDAEEITKAPALLITLDANGDGKLTQDEYQPPRPVGAGSPPSNGQQSRPPVSPFVAALDVNGDGVIDSDELTNASVTLKQLDKNGDGQLTQDEIRPPHPNGCGGHGGPPSGE